MSRNVNLCTSNQAFFYPKSHYGWMNKAGYLCQTPEWVVDGKNNIAPNFGKRFCLEQLPSSGQEGLIIIYAGKTESYSQRQLKKPGFSMSIATRNKWRKPGKSNKTGQANQSH
jgi:hypothetical protein